MNTKAAEFFDWVRLNYGPQTASRLKERLKVEETYSEGIMFGTLFEVLDEKELAQTGHISGLEDIRCNS